MICVLLKSNVFMLMVLVKQGNIKPARDHLLGIMKSYSKVMEYFVFYKVLHYLNTSTLILK